jgi:hypothetical protein
MGRGTRDPLIRRHVMRASTQTSVFFARGNALKHCLFVTVFIASLGDKI